MTIASALSAGIAVTAFTLLLFELLQKIEVEKTQSELDTKQIPITFRIFLPFASNVMPLVNSDAFVPQRKQAQEMLAMAGYDLSITGEQFVAIRILMGGIGVLGALLLFIAGQPIGGIMILFLALAYPGTWLKGTIRRRHLQMLKALPNVLDLLTLSVEAGKDFLTALRDILTRRKTDALGEELGRTLHEIQLGKQRQRALREMAQRVQQPELTSVVNAIVQADELGVSIGQLLRIQGDQLRAKRFSRAEKLANEAPVKILFPTVLFIFPAVFIILMGPIILQALKTFSK